MNSPQSFYVRERDFYIYSSYDKAASALVAHDKQESVGVAPSDESSINRTKKLMSELLELDKTRKTFNVSYDDDIFIFNKQHREEIFWPLNLKNDEQPSGVYISMAFKK